MYLGGPVGESGVHRKLTSQTVSRLWQLFDDRAAEVGPERRVPARDESLAAYLGADAFVGFNHSGSSGRVLQRRVGDARQFQRPTLSPQRIRAPRGRLRRCLARLYLTSPAIATRPSRRPFRPPNSSWSFRLICSSRRTIVPVIVSRTESTSRRPPRDFLTSDWSGTHELDGFYTLRRFRW